MAHEEKIFKALDKETIDALDKFLPDEFHHMIVASRVHEETSLYSIIMNTARLFRNEGINQGKAELREGIKRILDIT